MAVKTFIVDFHISTADKRDRAKKIIERWGGRPKRALGGYLSASFPSEDDARHAMTQAEGWGIGTAGMEKPSLRVLTALPQRKRNPPTGGYWGVAWFTTSKQGYSGWQTRMVGPCPTATACGLKNREEAKISHEPVGTFHVFHSWAEALAAKDRGRPPAKKRNPAFSGPLTITHEGSALIIKHVNPKRNPERLYHVVARNDRTGMDSYLTVRPELHHHAVTIMSKQTPIGRRYPHVRYMLVEANATTNRYAEEGEGPSGEKARKLNPASKRAKAKYHAQVAAHDYSGAARTMKRIHAGLKGAAKRAKRNPSLASMGETVRSAFLGALPPFSAGDQVTFKNIHDGDTGTVRKVARGYVPKVLVHWPRYKETVWERADDLRKVR